MSRKSILNLTATKKRDTMIGSVLTTSTGNPISGGYSMQATPVGSYAFLWTATARNRSGVDNDATRTQATCFMKGLKENLTLETTDGQAWQWRRICFKAKLGAAPITAYSGGAGVQRIIFPINQSSLPVDINNWALIRGLIFKGAQDTDWSDFMLAPTDNRRLDICYDKKRIIRSGNAEAVRLEPKIWHPMNKNIVYDDDENGAVTQGQPYSVTDKRGMGDYYVLDIFESVGPKASGRLVDGEDNALNACTSGIGSDRCGTKLGFEANPAPLPGLAIGSFQCEVLFQAFHEACGLCSGSVVVNTASVSGCRGPEKCIAADRGRLHRITTRDWVPSRGGQHTADHGVTLLRSGEVEDRLSAHPPFWVGSATPHRRTLARRAGFAFESPIHSVSEFSVGLVSHMCRGGLA